MLRRCVRRTYLSSLGFHFGKRCILFFTCLQKLLTQKSFPLGIMHRFVLQQDKFVVASMSTALLSEAILLAPGTFTSIIIFAPKTMTESDIASVNRNPLPSLFTRGSFLESRHRGTCGRTQVGTRVIKIVVILRRRLFCAREVQ